MANIVEQAIIELQSVYKGGGAEKAKKDLANLKRELKDANGSVQRLQSSLKQLNRVPIAFDDKRAMGGAGGQTTPRKAAIFAANEALREYFNTIKSGKRQLAGTEAGLRAQSAAFNKVAVNAKVAGDLYVGAVESQTRAEQKLRLAQIERIKVEKDLYATGRVVGNDAFKGVDELLRYGKTLPQITAALSVYKNELQTTLSVVEIGGEKYKKLKTEIQRVTEVMQGPKSTKKGLAGLKESLADAKKEQEELLVGRAGTKEWVEATVRVKKAQFEYNKELAKSRIGIAFINADINGSVRALNLAKQAAKGGLGLLGGAAGAIGSAGKKALGTRLGKIGAARGIDALAQKVPVVDKAFGRLLQKIPLLGKFLNENISVNARWTAQILEGITGVTVAWNGLNQIISAAQAFTAFERQAAIAINRVARMFKEMYNVAGAMMMGLISPGQVGKNLWDQALDRPEVMAARRGPSRLEQRELDQAELKAKIKNAEVHEVQLIEGLNRKLLEVERAITDETRERIQILKIQQDLMEGGPVWTQYGSPAGPGVKGAGWGSNAQDRLGDIQLRIGEAITANSLENRNAVSKLFLEEKKVNAELARRKEILRVIRQGVENVNLSVQAQRDLFGTSNVEALQAQREGATTQSPLAMRRNPKTQWKGPVSNEAWARFQRMQGFRRQSGQRFRENMMLGVGFPMLFGGGLGGVAGGAAGAVAQSKMGTKGGFGSQIILSALGQKFDQIVGQMIASTAKLGKAMNFFTADISAMTKAAGLAGTAEEKRLQFTEQVLGKQAAFNEAIKEMTSVVGQDGVAALQRFGEETTALSNAWNKFMTGVRASLANAINNSGIIQRINNLLNRDSGIPFAQSEFASEGLRSTASNLSSVQESIASTKANLGQSGGIKSGDEARAARARLGEEVYKAELKNLQVLEDQEKVLKAQIKDKSDLEQAINRQAMIQKAVNEATFGDMDRQNQLLKETIQFGGRRAQLNEKIRETQKAYLKNLQAAGEKIEKLSEKDKERVEDAILLNDQLTRMAELTDQIREKMAQGIGNAIKGLIDGTKTLSESLKDIAKQIADLILQKAILNMVDMIPFGSGGVTKGSVSDLSKVAVAAQGAYFENGIKPFSTGGMATRPTLGLIGEAGEDEYIIPASKMAASMQRYSAGARGEAVIPGTGSSSSGGTAGGSSTTVNYSGPILNFNSEEFVPKSAVGQIIATATSRGAKAGEARTLSSLKNSRSRRSTLGL